MTEEYIALTQLIHSSKTLTGTEYWLSRFVTNNPACLELKKKVVLWSRVSDPVLITGETGVGKELIANALHGNRKGKFVPVNCAGFVANEALMESILFGHVKGAFTGADSPSKGLVCSANDGTLFLDEIAELPLHVQAKLLRLLQEKKIRPLGAVDEIPVNVRIVCATKEPIEELVEAKKFREDLYYRLSVGRLYIPPLRERPEDVPLLTCYFFGGKIPDDFKLNDGELKGNVRKVFSLVRRYQVEKGMVTSDSGGLA